MCKRSVNYWGVKPVSRIGQTFQELKAKGEKALIPYVSCGDPSLEFTEQLVLKLSKAGADLLELGIPYSDPVADGPTIQKASQRALAAGVKLEGILRMAASLRGKIQTPLIFMTYFNVIYRYGLKQFVDRSLYAGIDGVIVPDLPPEEAGAFKRLMDEADLDLIFLAAPTSTGERLQKIASCARGFIYCVSVTGVTGSREKINADLATFIEKVRSHTDLPLAIGFGIANPLMARQVAPLAEGVIVGSSIIERIETNLTLINEQPDVVIEEICAYVTELKKAIN
jgi:tryptophan synthase alpha chain